MYRKQPDPHYALRHDPAFIYSQGGPPTVTNLQQRQSNQREDGRDRMSGCALLQGPRAGCPYTYRR